MDVAKDVDDLIPLAARLANNLCDAAKHPNVQDVVTNERRSQLALAMLQLLLAERKARVNVK